MPTFTKPLKVLVNVGTVMSDIYLVETISLTWKASAQTIFSFSAFSTASVLEFTCSFS